MIGQFSGPHSTQNLLYGPLKFEAAVVAKMFLDSSPSVLNFSSKKKKVSFTSEIVSKPAKSQLTIF